jgi:hypothetical protein
MAISRLTLTKLHAILAAFILPVGVMFFITGALYTWGKSGEYVTTKHELALAAPLSKDKDALVELARAELAKLQVPEPSGKPSVRSVGTSFQLEWSGAAMDVVLAPTADPLVAQLQVKDTTWYRHLVQLHKAKGGEIFKVYASVMAFALLMLLVSGYIIALQVPMLRRLTLATTAIGAVAFAGAFVLS